MARACVGGGLWDVLGLEGSIRLDWVVRVDRLLCWVWPLIGWGDRTMCYDDRSKAKKARALASPDHEATWAETKIGLGFHRGIRSSRRQIERRAAAWSQPRRSIRTAAKQGSARRRAKTPHVVVRIDPRVCQARSLAQNGEGINLG